MKWPWRKKYEPEVRFPALQWCSVHDQVLNQGVGFARMGTMWGNRRSYHDITGIEDRCGDQKDDFGEHCYDVTAPMREVS